jgi:hypothetical protein
MSKIKLNNQDSINLSDLINTRLLVQANSGGGKSWLLRRILEQSHGQVQQIIIDLEGEFSTLREKYDYVLVGKGGDTPADSRSAGLLAKKLLELNVSAIIDLYELHHQERKHFVKLFLESMINAPKELWHPCLVIIDEAHIFCPEKGQSEASEAVIDLATRGRKRGYCAVLATQRLSKLHKDAAAECNNKLIGRTGLDIDMKRASEELGFTSKDQYLSLRALDAGEFYAFGPAISTQIKKVKIGDVNTTHPKAGSRISLKTTPPTARIKQILKKLSDLPEEAKKELNTISELKSEIFKLRQHRCPKVVNTQTTQADIDKAVKQALKIAEAGFAKTENFYNHKFNRFIDAFNRAKKEMDKATDIYVQEETKKIAKQFKIPKVIIPKQEYRPVLSIQPHTPKVKILDNYQDEKPLTGGALRMLEVLVSRFPIQLSKVQLATFSRLKSSSGTFGTYMSILKSRGLIEEVTKDNFSASGEGIQYIGEDNIQPPQTSEEIISQWQRILKGGAKRMFDVLIQNYPASLSREQLGELTELISTSGTFGTYLSILKSNNLIETSNGEIKAVDNLFI